MPLKKISAETPVVVWAIVVLAAALRLTGLGWGLPELYHQDEPIIVNHALSIGAGGWNTGFFVIPPFTVNALFCLEAAYYAFGRAIGMFHGPADFLSAFLKDPTAVYLIGRFFLGALCGTLTVYAVWRGTRRFFSEIAARMAALFMAILPIHVAHSHYIYADIPVTLVTALVYFSMLGILSSPATRSYVRCGALLGWAASIKYTALYFAPVIVVPHVFAHRGRSARTDGLAKIAVSALACIAIFIIFAPTILLNGAAFISQLFVQSGSEGGVGYSHHGLYSILGGTGILFVLLAALGLLLMARSRPAEAAVTAAMIGLYYAVNIHFSQPFARYMLPLMPLLAVAAGIAAAEFLRLSGRVSGLIGVGLVCAELLMPSLYSDILFCGTDTRTACRRWFEGAVPAGTVVAVDNRFFAPHLLPTLGQIDDKTAGPGSELSAAQKKRLESMRDAVKGERTYETYLLALPEEERNRSFLFQRPMVGLSADDLRRIGTGYVIVNYADPDETKHRFIDSIRGELELVRSFSPYRDQSQRTAVDRHSTTAAPHLKTDLFSRKSLGPYLEIYRVKQNGDVK